MWDKVIEWVKAQNDKVQHLIAATIITIILIWTPENFEVLVAMIFVTMAKEVGDKGNYVAFDKGNYFDIAAGMVAAVAYTAWKVWPNVV